MTHSSAPQAAGIWPLMRPVIGRVRLSMGLAALGAAAGLGAIAALALTVDALLDPAPRPWPWVGLAVALTVAAFVLRALAARISHFAAFALEAHLRTELAAHLAGLPLGHLVDQGSGALAKVMQDDVNNLHAFVADSTPLLGRGTAAPLLTLALLLVIDWRLALVALGVLALGAAAIRLALRDHVDLQRQYDAERERIHNAVVEFVQAMPVVRSFDDGSSSFSRYQAALDGFHAVLSRWLAASATSARLGIVLLGPLPTLLALSACGLWWVQDGSLGFAAWIAVLLLGTGMAESLMPLMWLTHFIRKADASARRIQALLAVPALALPERARQPMDASVRFADVGFAYAGRTDAALDGVSFDAPAGSVTALVGPSGAGKSTVAKLIPRFWDATRGAVYVGGADVREMTPDALLGQVAFVFQDSFLFHDSIAANIRLGRPDADQAAIEAAARAAQAHDFILALPQGYASVAGERGARLSGGQRQRIAIARAILLDRPIVVLDEATAFADPENEAALVAALANLMRGRTVIVIAHRLATIRDADQILVFDRGRIAERGRHAGLLAAGGVYARLWHSHERAQGWQLRQRTAMETPA